MPKVKAELLINEVYDRFIEEAIKRSDAFGFDISEDEDLSDFASYRINPANCSNASDHMYRISNKTKELLLKPNGILDWTAPNFPNDLAFYKSGYCWFYTIICENDVTLCVDNADEIAVWKKAGVEFADEFNYFDDVVNRIFCKYDYKTKIIDNEIIG